MKSDKESISLQRLREAIPDHYFQPVWHKSLGYLLRDVCIVVTLAVVAWEYIPRIPSVPLRYIAWALYGLVQGLVFTGLWEMAHESGHGSFLPTPLANNIAGLALHSFLLIPFFSWRSTHRKHHRYTAHMEKDHNHIPYRYSEYLVSASRQKELSTVLSKVQEYIEDAPLYLLSRLLFQQILGMPAYLIFSIASATASSDYRHDESVSKMPAWISKNHFNPFASLFRPDEVLAIALGDLGLAAIVVGLWAFGKSYGSSAVLLLYVQPWLWVNHWIVAVTFLQHTHPHVPKYEAEAWTFTKGATATIDRNFGFIGKHFFHNITDFHVVHHLFPRIPFYYSPEATKAIRPLLGDAYRRDDTNLVYALWRDFTACQWLVPDKADRVEDQALWFVGPKGQVTTRISLT